MSTVETMVSIAEKKVFVIEKMVFAIEKMFSIPRSIFSLTRIMVSVLETIFARLQKFRVDSHPEAGTQRWGYEPVFIDERNEGQSPVSLIVAKEVDTGDNGTGTSVAVPLALSPSRP